MTVQRPKGAKGKADRLFSLIVRSRGSCEHCGDRRYDRLQTAHIHSRRFNATRTDETNALCLCASCHRYFTDRPIEFAEFVRRHIGEGAYDALRQKAHAVTKVDWYAEADRLAAVWADIQRTAA